MKSWSSGSWKTTPTRRRISLRFCLSTGIPETLTVPAPAVRIPLRCSTSVVLPAPLGPSRATRSPLVHVQVDAEERLVAVGVGVGEAADLEYGGAHQ